MYAVKRPPTRAVSFAASASTQRSHSRSREERLIGVWRSTIERAAARASLSFGGGQAQSDDIAQAARLGVLRTVRKPIPLPDTYIRSAIANAIRRWLRDERAGCTVWSASACVLDEATEGAFVVDLDLADVEVKVEVSRWVRTLPKRLHELFVHIYVVGRSQRMTAKLMHVSQPRVAQLHAQLLQLARRDLAHLAG